MIKKVISVLTLFDCEYHESEAFYLLSINFKRDLLKYLDSFQTVF